MKRIGLILVLGVLFALGGKASFAADAGVSGDDGSPPVCASAEPGECDTPLPECEEITPTVSVEKPNCVPDCEETPEAEGCTPPTTEEQTTTTEAPVPTTEEPPPPADSGLTCEQVGHVTYYGLPDYDEDHDSDNDGIGCEEYLAAPANPVMREVTYTG